MSLRVFQVSFRKVKQVVEVAQAEAGFLRKKQVEAHGSHGLIVERGFQKEVKRCTCWVLEVTVLYICLLYTIVVFCFLQFASWVPHISLISSIPRASPPMSSGHRTNWATQKGEWRMSWSTYQAWTGPLRDSGWLPILMEEYVMLYVDTFGMYIVGST